MIELNYSLILQIICVILLYLILSRFLFSRIHKIFEERDSLIDGKRQEASKLDQEIRDKESKIQRSLESTRQELGDKLKTRLSATEATYDERLNKVMNEGQQKLVEVKKDLEKDIKDLESSVDQHSSSIYQLILNKLGVQ